MPGQEFFERMAPEFAEHASSARENAQRQVDVERLIATAEYEFLQMRRALTGLLPGAVEPSAEQTAAPAPDQVVPVDMTLDAPSSAPAQPLNEAA
jgi:hypothetical protein